MEEDVEDLASFAGIITAMARGIILSDEMDFSTKKSQLLANTFDAITFDDDDDDEDESVFFKWYYDMCTWVSLKFAETNYHYLRMPPLVKRDDRLTSLTCYAAFASIQEVIEKMVPKLSCPNNDDTRRSMQAIREEILDSFDILCKDLLIEKSWDVFSIRQCIVEAQKFAIDYINYSQANNLCFPGIDEQCDLLLWMFQGYLIGNFEQDQEFLLKKNASNSVMNNDTIGLSVHIENIKDRLTNSNSNLDIIPIIGMGGIGKTTLARKVYTDPLIMPLFHVHAWIVVSQIFHERDVFLALLESIAPLPSEVYNDDTEQLVERLYRRLKGRRYFIIIDDIWTKEAWDCIKLGFPTDHNGSRIILTSRTTEVASHVDPENPPYLMSFLSIEDSWELLRKRVYGEKFCPRELINTGRQIAEKCQGLPLAIEVMAGYLSSISKTQESWEDVAKSVDFPTEVTQSESLAKIIFISFHDLSLQLKRCFLTMTLLPKNVDISVRKLLHMWTAMGFLCQNSEDIGKDVTLEEVAMACFKSLIDRSLIMVKEKKFNGKAKICGVHDLLWDLSMREFCKQFSCDDVDQDQVIHINQTLLYYGHSFELDYPASFDGFKLLKVLIILHQSFDNFPIYVTDLGNLRYLALATTDNIPPSIQNLSYLETLLNFHKKAGQVLPVEIWLLAHLKRLHVGTCTFLCEPSNLCAEGSSNSLLPCLLSIPNLSLASCSKGVFFNIPHLKQLGIVEHEQNDVGDDLLCCALKNIIHLDQLEKFKLYCNFVIDRPRCIPGWSSFLPNTIKKLTLSRILLPWSEMKTLSKLSNLEVLKLKANAFRGEKWEMEDEEFGNLKYLLLEAMDLIFWKANTDNFPILQQLIIRCCGSLCEIPREFGGIYTLKLIVLDFYSPTTHISAIKIQQEQINLGNDRFNLQLHRVLPVFHTLGYILLFVWLAMRLNITMPKEEDGKEKQEELPQR